MLALPWAAVLVFAILAGVARLIGLPATEIALTLFLQAAGLMLFFQASLLLAVGIVFAWRFVTERQRIAAFLCHVAEQLGLRASRWARHWRLIFRGLCVPVRLPSDPSIRLVCRDRVAIIGSGFVAGESPQLEYTVPSSRELSPYTRVRSK